MTLAFDKHRDKLDCAMLVTNIDCLISAVVDAYKMLTIKKNRTFFMTYKKHMLMWKFPRLTKDGLELCNKEFLL